MLGVYGSAWQVMPLRPRVGRRRCQLGVSIQSQLTNTMFTDQSASQRAAAAGQNPRPLSYCCTAGTLLSKNANAPRETNRTRHGAAGLWCTGRSRYEIFWACSGEKGNVASKMVFEGRCAGLQRASTKGTTASSRAREPHRPPAAPHACAGGVHLVPNKFSVMACWV
jgi:hypothetical protein